MASVTRSTPTAAENVSGACSRVFEREGASDYDRLSANDKGVVNEYMRANLGVDPADAAGAKRAYGDLKSMVDF